jgi:Domain of unknown function (DUF5666)
MSEHHYEEQVYEQETLVDPEPWEVEDELPARPRRPLVTPVRAGLAAVVIAAAGFFGGVEVQKSQGSNASSGAPAAVSGAARAGGGGFGGFGGQASNATFGTVTSKNGSSLYVQDANGTTVKVRMDSNSKITRTANASGSAIHPGDTVVVQGSKSSNGTVTASQITAATARGAGRGFLRGGFGGAPGAGGGSGGAPPAAGSGG